MNLNKIVCLLILFTFTHYFVKIIGMKKLISADDFQVLMLNEKAQLIFELGEEFYHYFNETNLIKLYILFDFFIEVMYLPQNNKIKQIDVITDSYLTEKYISNIDISDLFKRN